MDINGKISEELNVNKKQVNSTIKLLEEGNTVPFISRYRKEATGNLNEEQIRNIEEKFNYYTKLEDYKQTVIKNINEQGNLSDSLREKILKSEKLSDVEDLYLPYKKRKKTKADIAVENGLEPASIKVMLGEDIDDEYLKNFINDNFKSKDDIKEGIGNIIGQSFAHDKENRDYFRNLFFKFGRISTNKKKKFKEEFTKYDVYDNFSQLVKAIPDYRVLAINRGEKENILSVKVVLEEEKYKSKIKEFLKGKKLNDEIISMGLNYGLKNMLLPSLEREIRQTLTVRAEENSISLFSENLKQLLLTPPLKNKRILAMDPGFRTGCKVVALDEYGNLLENTTIFPVEPKNEVEKSMKIIDKIIDHHKLNLIVIGNATASRETQQFIVQYIKQYDKNLKYIFANESGASVYSASKLAKKEFPDKDVTVRGAVSLGRRVQDPLAELVKIDPKSIGVGQYQHDVDQKSLKEKLRNTVESVVNNVGVNANTASYALLEHVSGLNSNIAKKLVEYREKNGPFKERKDILNVKGIGAKSFEQAAGFLKIYGGINPLEITSIHPESYEIAEKLLNHIGFKKDDILNKNDEIRSNLISFLNDENRINEMSESLNTGIYTLKDIINDLLKPGRDPRDELPQPILFDDILNFEDLKEGMKLEGKVNNITDFGAFIDLGIKENGLIHKSNIAEKFVKHPSEYLSINQIVTVEIIEIDPQRKRISLKLIK
ncbi:Tex-like N-terminal domain-containing protein [Geotoga petraea]|uniref:RNA-binding transcriptional accessory protein n=1 Tax=Geotoga petraea TaxID=28234 RepID=A0A4Z0VWB4_9BACT|nr:Tex family protein [Geotoga petraea]TGG88374.1 RNA-binding transcriptional accessory protein [Geotoga petraea]